MALTGTDRGTGTHNTSATSFTLNPGSNFTAGALAVLCIAADNSVSGGATNNITGVTDSLGNAWRARQKPIFDNGAASAGVQGGIFTTDQGAGTLQTGTTITVTFGTAAVAKTWTLMEVTAAAGFKAMALTGANAAGQAASSAPTVTTGTIAVGDMVIATVAMEAGTTQTLTGDADTTNGTWSAAQYAEIGSTTSGSAIGSQCKVQTTTASTQTFNPELGLTCDLICSWISVREVKAKPLALAGVG
jgi:hypothetical protein